MKPFRPPFFVLLVLLLAMFACGESSSEDTGQAPAATEAVAVAPTEAETAAPTEAEAAAPTEAPPPTEPPPPTDTPTPTDTPVPVEPVVFLTLEGTEEIVSDNFEAPACEKAVFAWTVEPGEMGMTALIVNLQQAGSTTGVPIVNALGMDGEGTLSGETLQALDGGSYFVSTENITGAWSVTGTCFDGQAPVGSDVDLAGTGDAVTENYALPLCGKSVIAWSVEPNEAGMASLIVGLQKVGERLVPVVNALEMDVVDPQSGEALVPLMGGTYFFTVENASGPWTVVWECRD